MASGGVEESGGQVGSVDVLGCFGCGFVFVGGTGGGVWNDVVCGGEAGVGLPGCWWRSCWLCVGGVGVVEWDGCGSLVFVEFLESWGEGGVWSGGVPSGRVGMVVVVLVVVCEAWFVGQEWNG